MFDKIKAFWGSLPHKVQASVVVFVTTAGETIIHAFEDLGVGQCATWSCVGTAFRGVFSPHMIATALFSGFAAWKLFYMTANRDNNQQSKP